MSHCVLGHTLAETLGGTFADVCEGKGGFWIKGKGFYSIAAARRITGIKPPKHNLQERQPAWGDYATIAMLNGVRK